MVEFSRTAASQTVNGVTVPAGSFRLRVHRNRFSAEDVRDGFSSQVTLTAGDGSATATKTIYFYMLPIANEAAVRIEPNPAFSDTALSLAANEESSVDVSSAFLVYPAATAWTLSASSADIDVASVVADQKSLRIAAALNLPAPDSTTITYTGTAGSATASRRRVVNVAAPPVGSITSTTLTATPTVTQAIANRVAGTDYSVGGIGQTSAMPLNFGIGTDDSLRFDIPASELFSTSIVRTAPAISAVSPSSVRGNTQDIITVSADRTTLSIAVVWADATTSQETNGVSLALQITATDGARSATRTLHVFVGELQTS